MKKLVVVSLMAACMFSGCRTVVEGEAERYDNGQLVGRSKMRVLATGDKASQIAAEGIGVNAEPDEVNAVLNSTSASQKSSGIDNVLKAFSDLALNVASMRLNGATASQDAVYDIVNTATGF